MHPGLTSPAFPASPHPVRRGAALRRLAGLLVVAVASLAVTAAALVSAQSATTRTDTLSWHRTAATLSLADTTAKAVAAGNVARRLGLPAKSAAAVPGSLVLTARDHRLCPRAATACVDLTRHLSWLQAHGKVTFGPVP